MIFMMTEQQYSELLLHIETLMESDPDPTSSQGIALNALVDEAIAYELHHFPMFSDKPLIAALADQ